MCSMSNVSFIVDEGVYPVSWRFNSKDCRLSDDEKKKIVFLVKSEAQILWDLFFPFKHLMELEYDSMFFSILEEVILDFGKVEKSACFFESKLNDVNVVFFFWGRASAAIVSKDIFINAWDDFFYPSDETSIILVPNSDKVIFSFEEKFFYGKINRTG